MLTTYLRDEILTYLKGTSLTDSPTHIALATAFTDFRAGTYTEATYTNYARQTIASGSFTANADTTPAGGRETDNGAAISFPQNGGSSEDVIGFVITDATDYERAWGLLDSDPPIWGTVTLASPGVITAYAHGLQTDQRVFFLAAPGAVTPTGISENTAYYVGTVPNSDSFTLSTTASNANPVNTTGAGAGLFMPYKAVTIAASATPQFGIGALVIQV
jgi:hypothetical protein